MGIFLEKRSGKYDDSNHPVLLRQCMFDAKKLSICEEEANSKRGRFNSQWLFCVHVFRLQLREEEEGDEGRFPIESDCHHPTDS